MKRITASDVEQKVLLPVVLLTGAPITTYTLLPTAPVNARQLEENGIVYHTLVVLAYGPSGTQRNCFRNDALA